jgi:hypothetical protein
MTLTQQLELKTAELAGLVHTVNSLAYSIQEDYQNGMLAELDLQELGLRLSGVEQAALSLSRTCSHLRFILLKKQQGESLTA